MSSSVRNLLIRVLEEDIKEFLDIVDKNKAKLESLLDKVPFTLTAFFPEVEYSTELVQKLRPLIKNWKFLFDF